MPDLNFNNIQKSIDTIVAKFNYKEEDKLWDLEGTALDKAIDNISKGEIGTFTDEILKIVEHEISDAHPGNKKVQNAEAIQAFQGKVLGYLTQKLRTQNQVTQGVIEKVVLGTVMGMAGEQERSRLGIALKTAAIALSGPLWPAVNMAIEGIRARQGRSTVNKKACHLSYIFLALTVTPLAASIALPVMPLVIGAAAALTGVAGMIRVLSNFDKIWSGVPSAKQERKMTNIMKAGLKEVKATGSIAQDTEVVMKASIKALEGSSKSMIVETAEKATEGPQKENVQKFKPDPLSAYFNLLTGFQIGFNPNSIPKKIGRGAQAGKTAVVQASTHIARLAGRTANALRHPTNIFKRGT